MREPEIEIKWEEAMIEDVLDYFVKGYDGLDGEIVKHEATLDSRTGKVVFKLFIQEQP